LESSSFSNGLTTRRISWMYSRDTKLKVLSGFALMFVISQNSLSYLLSVQSTACTENMTSFQHTVCLISYIFLCQMQWPSSSNTTS